MTKRTKSKYDEWQTCTYQVFKNRLNGIIKDSQATYQNIGDNVLDNEIIFIPPSRIIIALTGKYSSHWRRDFLSEKVKDGKRKLALILRFLADQELIIANNMIRFKKGRYNNAITLLLNTYYNKQNDSIDYALEENEVAKDKIVIKIGDIDNDIK